MPEGAGTQSAVLSAEFRLGVWSLPSALAFPHPTVLAGAVFVRTAGRRALRKADGAELADWRGDGALCHQPVPGR